MFLDLTQILIALFLLYIVITQLILPTYSGLKLFPMFRRTGKIEGVLGEALQDQADLEILDEANKTLDKTIEKKGAKKK